MAEDDQKIVNYSTDEPAISPDTEPTMYEKVTNQPWFGWAVRVVLAIILIVLIFFGARWIHHRSQHGAVNNPRGANTANTPSQPNGTSPTPKATKKSDSGRSANNNGNSPSGSASSGKGPVTTPNQQLSNTGPGDVAAIFLATVFAVASLHYVIDSRRDV